MKSRLLNKNAYEPVCRNCRHGRLSPEGDSVLCVKKGITDPDGTCKRYSYDPLKRIPKKPLTVSSASPEDFDLSIGFEEPPCKAEPAAHASLPEVPAVQEPCEPKPAEEEYESAHEDEDENEEQESGSYLTEDIGTHEEAPKKLWTKTRLFELGESDNSEQNEKDGFLYF